MIALYLEQWNDGLNNSSTLLIMHIISINIYDGPMDQIPFIVYCVILNYFLNYKRMQPPCNRMWRYAQYKSKIS